jgi:hypothetical protein
MRVVAAFAACAVLAGTAPAFAQATGQAPFLCVGVGADQRELAANTPYSLKLMFAEPDGHYVADVTVRITDASGAVPLYLVCGGPWLLVDLPAGTYQVEAAFEGQTKTQSVTVGQGQREQLITF